LSSAEKEAFENNKKKLIVLQEELDNLKRDFAELNVKYENLLKEQSGNSQRMISIVEYQKLQEDLKNTKKIYSELQMDHQDLRREKEALKENTTNLIQKEEKLKQELERLRSHLLTQNEEATLEGIRNNEIIKELQEIVNSLQQQLQNYKNLDLDRAPQAEEKDEELQQTILFMAAQIKDLEEKIETKIRENTQLSLSLNNLQSALDLLQAENDVQLANTKTQLQKKAKEQEEIMEGLKRQIAEKESKIKQLNDDLEQLKPLKLQLEIKENELEMTKRELTKINLHLNQSLDKLNYMSNESHPTIDKKLITNLLVKYFSGKEKEEILQVIANVLNFDFDQRLAVGLIKPEKPGLLRWPMQMLKSNISSSAAAPSPTHPNTSKTATPEESFTDLWIGFLLQEAKKG